MSSSIPTASTTNDEPGLTLDRLHFAYKKNPILKDLSWELPAGRSALVTGSTGSGKSSLLYLAAGLILPAQGTVLQRGYPLKQLLPSQRVQKGLRVGFVFQEGGLLANHTVYSNVTLPLHYHADVLKLSAVALAERAEQALDAMQITRRHWQELPAHLSYGNRKRLLTARALAFRPNFFFYDDPDAGTDPRTTQLTQQVLWKMRDDPEVTLVVATNRPHLIESLTIPAYRIERGRLTQNFARDSFIPQQ